MELSCLIKQGSTYFSLEGARNENLSLSLLQRVHRDKSRFPHPRDAASKNLLDARRRFYRATERSVRRLDEDFRPTRCLLFSTVSRERERKKEKTETVLFIVFFNGSASWIIDQVLHVSSSFGSDRWMTKASWKNFQGRLRLLFYPPFFFHILLLLFRRSVTFFSSLSLSRWLKSIYICVYVNNSFRELETRRGHVSLAGFRRAWRKKGRIDKRKGYLFLLRVKRRWRSSRPQPSPR